MTERTTCAIIGGGPAGMILGLLLARAGVRVTVLEKHGDFLRDFRGDTVHPSTLQLLDELGLGERFAQLPQSRLERLSFTGENGERLLVGDMRRLKVAHPYIAMVPQWDLLDLLARASKAEPTYELRMNTEVTGLLTGGGAVRGVRYRTAAGETGELRADLTVACDGRWSLAREEALLRPREFPCSFDVWWFRLPRYEDEGVRSLSPAMRRGEFAVRIPREGYFQIGYMVEKGTASALRAEGVEHFRERIAACFPAFADRVGALESMDDVKHLDVRLNRLHQWHRPGLLCIGDAAHAMSPIGGVGINLAVQDAVAAAHVLAGPLRRGRLTPRTLARVRTRRLLPTVATQAVQRMLHRNVVTPVIEGRRNGPPHLLSTLLRYAPRLSSVPARLIGVGFRPEHAPEFARRRADGRVP
ncbi:FAD-dependent oxidoreductase [Streptomyces sp. ODS28]|uniref:FAD-dependent oxidoreductase n=1 Tax=Streptomyces sp. ODS28 TaxID=3136688 RepID=UPI0031E527B2